MALTMSVVLKNNATTYTRSVDSSRKATDNFAFSSAHDYIYNDSKHFQRSSQRDGRLQNLQSGKSSVAVVLGYFNGQEYIRDQLQSILHQTDFQ